MWLSLQPHPGLELLLLQQDKAPCVLVAVCGQMGFQMATSCVTDTWCGGWRVGGTESLHGSRNHIPGRPPPICSRLASHCDDDNSRTTKERLKNAVGGSACSSQRGSGLLRGFPPLLGPPRGSPPTVSPGSASGQSTCLSGMDTDSLLLLPRSWSEQGVASRAGSWELRIGPLWTYSPSPLQPYWGSC